MKRIKYGIIGIGRWATEVHIPVVNRINEAEIAALSSRNSENLEKGCRLSTDRPRAFGNYSDLLNLREIDAVIVTTPNHTHAEIVKAALEHGKHVFCEKPLATTVEDCDMLSELAQREKKVLQVGLELRYAPIFMKVKELITQGRIGDPCLSFCNLSRGWLRPGWREDPDLTGGIFLELGCHYLDLFGYLLDSQALKVAGLGGKTSEHTDIDHAYIIIDYDNGAKASMRLNLLSPYDTATIIGVIGTLGKIEVQLHNKELTLWQDRFPEYKRSFRFHQDTREPGFSGTYQQHMDFADCIRSGNTPKASARVGRDVVALALAIHKAIREKTVVSPV
jgi:predicted dehydrogenase